MTRKQRADQLHQRALGAARKFHQSEAELIEILRQMDASRAYRELGYTSLFSYAVKALKLSENVAYAFITVSRKAARVPELDQAIRDGSLNVNKAKKIASMLGGRKGPAPAHANVPPAPSPANRPEAKPAPAEPARQEPEQVELIQKAAPPQAPPPPPRSDADWIELAKNLSSREIEKKVAEARPEEAKPETARYISGNRLSVSLSMEEKAHKALLRAQDLESRRRGRAVSLEETIVAMTEDYLEKRDPVRKAERQKARADRRQETAARLAGDLVAGRVEAPASELVTGRAEAPASELVTGRVGGPGNELDTGRAEAPANELVTGQARNPSTELAMEQVTFEQTAPTARRAIPAAVDHERARRDQDQCTALDPDGTRCPERRWLHAHHLREVQHGGPNTLANLTTLCSAHHRMRHLQAG